MKITNTFHRIDFCTLAAGDVFFIDDFGIFMKTETKSICNAVNLSNGKFIECGNYCKVQKVDCELIIY